MLLLQDINVNANTAIKLSHESEVQWTKDAFVQTGLLEGVTEGSDEELEVLLKIARQFFIKSSKQTPSPYMHNPALFEFVTDDETTYQGVVTDGGNILVIQTATLGSEVDDVYQIIGYEGTRGRFIQELDWIIREHNIDSYSDLISERPIRYETNGDTDMLPYESALSYSIRQYESGEKEPLKYWLNKATMDLASGKPMMATSESILNYLKEKDDTLAADWEAFEASVRVMNNLAAKVVHR